MGRQPRSAELEAEGNEALNIPKFLQSKPIDAWSRGDWSYIVDTDTGETLAHAFLRDGKIPESFTFWDIKDGSGDTVAHAAGREGLLPDTFDQWRMLNSRGWSVAHSTASSKLGRFPDNFSDWAFDLDGNTVLGMLILAGKCLPENFCGYDFLDSQGQTIEDLAKRFSNPVVLAQLEAHRMSEAIHTDSELKKNVSRIARHVP